MVPHVCKACFGQSPRPWIRHDSGRGIEEPLENSHDDPGDTARSLAGRESFPVCLTESDLRTMDGFSTARKAEWIVYKHIKDRFGADVGIEKDNEGADLRISRNGKTERIEVKGTKSKNIAWAQLKVSSQRSHDALRSGAVSMYRVTDVHGPKPCVHILKHGRDYELTPEPRWAVKPAGKRTYPLRGRRYRYELPHEAVASNEWGVLG